MSNLKRRIELCKLIIARDSMEAVAKASGWAMALNIDHNHPLYRALHDTIVTSYGRAFTEIQPLGYLPKKWAEFDDDELKRTHEMLMYYRNKNVGHTDFISGRVVVYPKGAKIDNEHIAPNIQVGVLSQSFAANELIAVQKVAGNLAGRLMVEIDKQMTILYGDQGVNLKSTTDLITEDELEQLHLARRQNRRKKQLVKKVGSLIRAITGLYHRIRS